MKNEIAEKILKETESGYDLIAHKFSQTRKHFWRELEFMTDYVAEEDNVLDFGCGNGRLLELIGYKKIAYWGVDVSDELVSIAQNEYGQTDGNSVRRRFAKIDSSQTTLALEDNFFNSVYSIAVFHHIPSAAKRVELVRELFRVTKPGGYVVVTVWNLWQKKYRKNILQNWWRKILTQSKLDWRDCYISFTDNKGSRFQRFHHAFTKRELQKLFSSAGFEIEKCKIVDGRNIVLIGKK